MQNEVYFNYQLLLRNYLFNKLTPNDCCKASDFANKIYESMPSYRHLVLHDAYNSLMEAKYKQVFEAVVNNFPISKLEQEVNE